MRLNFKIIIAAGALLGVAQVWWQHESADNSRELSMAGLDPLKAKAKELRTQSGGVVAKVTVPNWQAKVGDVIAGGAAPTEQARNLLASLPGMPVAGQIETAHHVANLMGDESYATLASYLTNTAVSPEARTVIYSDLMHRPNALKVPLLLELARNPVAPNQAHALQVLRNTIREDYGSDWTAWQTRIAAWLKANPDPTPPGVSGTMVGN